MFGKVLPPLVHHEDGFNSDEAVRLKPERTLMRRLAFPAAAAVVVPSGTLEDIALNTWKQPPARVYRIPNGIQTVRYAAKPKPNAIPGLRKKAGETVIGTVAGLRPVKNLPRLVEAALMIPGTRLVIIGEGPEKEAIAAKAREMGVTQRLVLPGFLPEPHKYIGLFDIFALSSDSEQFPIAMVEAMAAGLPVATTHVGDVAVILPPEQLPLVAECDEYALAAALRQLVADKALRTRLGAANQKLATAAYDEKTMVAAYARLYDKALGTGVHFASGTL
jgi:glycosyltransferase involved in cell wall biosynthesis